MTARKVVIMICNGCEALALPPGLILVDLVHLETPAPDSVVDARHAAARKGWRHTASGKDLCPACQSSKRSPAKSGGLLSHIPHPHWGNH
jgi:hypothetical protein